MQSSYIYYSRLLTYSVYTIHPPPRRQLWGKVIYAFIHNSPSNWQSAEIFTPTRHPTNGLSADFASQFIAATP